MTAENKAKILVDLTPALQGYAGVPQEARLLFKALACQDTLLADGLLYASHRNMLFHDINTPPDYKTNILQTANYFYDFIRQDFLLKKSNKTGMGKLLLTIKQMKGWYLLTRFSRFETREVLTDHFFDFMWRVFFAKTLLLADYPLLQQQRYFISNLNTNSLRFLNSVKKKAQLNTKAWDVVIFQTQRAVAVSPGTTKIVRYHDSIPLSDMDVVVPDGTGAHSRELLSCMQDSFYVCNSEPTRAALVKMVPELAERSATIAPIIASYHRMQDRHVLLSAIEKSIVGGYLTETEQQTVMAALHNNPDFPYLLILATIEPRKNHITLIRAWERLRAKIKKPLRLIIVGSLGWDYEDIQNAIRPHVKKGDILHVEKILPEEMGYFYSHAQAFIFPSYNEGFGCPPLEAMQCDCPVIVSDIPTHRWVYGEAALYCNPYDVTAFVNAMEQLLYADDRETLRQTLLAKANIQLKRYAQDKIGEEWQALLSRFKKKS